MTKTRASRPAHKKTCNTAAQASIPQPRFFAFFASLRLLALAVFCGIALFSLVVHPFYGYGYAYIQYLPPYARMIILAALLGAILFVPRRWMENMTRWLSQHYSLVLVVSVMCGLVVFWCFKTKIHVFMGDGAVGTIPTQLGLSVRRLDDLVRGLFSYYVLQVISPDRLHVLPSMFSQQIYSIAFGLLTIVTLTLGFRSSPLIPLVFLTMPWVFNFFGNVDSYAFSVWYATLFATVGSHLVTKREELRFPHVLLIVAMWALGLWVHPFHLFFGFLVVFIACEWLRYRRWSTVPTWATIILYGIALFVFIKASRFSNNLTTINRDLVPPFFSWQTFTHYLNNLFLPLLPLVCFTHLNSKRTPSNFPKIVCLVMALSSVTFFTMAFTLGACDQFNYHHLLAILACYYVVLYRLQPPTASHCYFIVLLHALVLIPMVLVHSSSKTIERASDIYPHDKCHHNSVMSWQTHLGIVLGDNIQHDAAIERNVLRIFRNGAEFADPEGFRFGNYVYYVAWHYHFGRIDEGRKLLADMLRRYPQSVRFLLSDRPAFTYHNRELLWDDVLRFFPARNAEDKTALASAIQQARDRARSRPYFTRTSKYEVKREPPVPGDACP